MKGWIYDFLAMVIIIGMVAIYVFAMAK